MHGKKLILSAILYAFFPLVAFADTGIVVTQDNLENILQTSANLKLGVPAESDTIINRNGYALGYSEKHKQAGWVAYKLTKEEVLNKVCNRSDNFRQDPLIKTKSASLGDYRGSGYDRGHLAPAADMHWSKTTMSESFYLSNMSPQRPYFNRGVWRKLEALVRQWAVNNDAIYVVTGPVFGGDLTNSIGANRVTVPDHYYKVILDYEPPDIKAIGLILENRKSSSCLSSFAVTIDKVESVTGMDFFSSLPDNIEDTIESHIDISKWTWQTTSLSYTRNPPSKKESVSSHSEQEIDTYVASRNSNKFHRSGCRYAKTISEHNLVKFEDRSDAAKNGRQPCKACNP